MLCKRLIPALLIVFMSGCAHYMYDGQKFGDRSKAEAAQRAQFESIRSAAAFKPRATPVARNLRFVMPSKTLMLDRGILPTGSADGRDYVATTLHADFRFNRGTDPSAQHLRDHVGRGIVRCRPRCA